MWWSLSGLSVCHLLARYWLILSPVTISNRDPFHTLRWRSFQFNRSVAINSETMGIIFTSLSSHAPKRRSKLVAQQILWSSWPCQKTYGCIHCDRGRHYKGKGVLYTLLQFWSFWNCCKRWVGSRPWLTSPPYADSITLTKFLPGKGKIFSRGRVKPISFPPDPGGVLPFEMGRIQLVGVLTGNPIPIGDPTALKLWETIFVSISRRAPLLMALCENYAVVTLFFINFPYLLQDLLS